MLMKCCYLPVVECCPSATSESPELSSSSNEHSSPIEQTGSLSVSSPLEIPSAIGKEYTPLVALTAQAQDLKAPQDICSKSCSMYIFAIEAV